MARNEAISQALCIWEYIQVNTPCVMASLLPMTELMTVSHFDMLRVTLCGGCCHLLSDCRVPECLLAIALLLTGIKQKWRTNRRTTFIFTL